MASSVRKKHRGKATRCIFGRCNAKGNVMTEATEGTGSDIRCQTVWTQPCVEWTLCVKIAAKLSEKACVKVHEHVSVQLLCLNACIFFVCTRFAYVTVHLCMSWYRRSWGSCRHLRSHFAVKCDGRKWGRGGEGGTQLEELSGVFHPSKTISSSPKC